MNKLLSVSNFRSIRTRAIAEGGPRLYRSGAFDRLSEADAIELQRMGIELCIDLRGSAEKKIAPNQFGSFWSPSLVECEIISDIRSLGSDLSKILDAHPDADGARQLMVALYQSLPQACAPALTQFMELICTANKAPNKSIVVHCTAGKDRTGFICAILQLAVGVPRAMVFEDYLLSGAKENRTPINQRTVALLQALLGNTPTEETVEALLGVQSIYLEAALEKVIQKYGSIDEYLLRCVGTSELTLRNLRQRLSRNPRTLSENVQSSAHE
jgi:protein-tyrosine phosphatase